MSTIRPRLLCRRCFRLRFRRTRRRRRTRSASRRIAWSTRRMAPTGCRSTRRRRPTNRPLAPPNTPSGTAYRPTTGASWRPRTSAPRSTSSSGTASRRIWIRRHFPRPFRLSRLLLFFRPCFHRLPRRRRRCRRHPRRPQSFTSTASPCSQLATAGTPKAAWTSASLSAALRGSERTRPTSTTESRPMRCGRSSRTTPPTSSGPRSR